MTDTAPPSALPRFEEISGCEASVAEPFYNAIVSANAVVQRYRDIIEYKFRPLAKQHPMGESAANSAINLLQTINSFQLLTIMWAKRDAAEKALTSNQLREPNTSGIQENRYRLGIALHRQNTHSDPYTDSGKYAQMARRVVNAAVEFDLLDEVECEGASKPVQATEVLMALMRNAGEAAVRGLPGVEQSIRELQASNGGNRYG